MSDFLDEKVPPVRPLSTAAIEELGRCVLDQLDPGVLEARPSAKLWHRGLIGWRQQGSRCWRLRTVFVWSSTIPETPVENAPSAKRCRRTVGEESVSAASAVVMPQMQTLWARRTDSHALSKFSAVYGRRGAEAEMRRFSATILVNWLDSVYRAWY